MNAQPPHKQPTTLSPTTRRWLAAVAAHGACAMLVAPAAAYEANYQRACTSSIIQYCASAGVSMKFLSCDSAVYYRTCYYSLYWDCEGSGTPTTAASLSCNLSTWDSTSESGAPFARSCAWDVLQAGCTVGTQLHTFWFSPGSCYGGDHNFGEVRSTVSSLVGGTQTARADAWIVYPPC
ncbi:MAG: hypothetical protein QOI63_1810 [Thermoplasmata archaeon]|nr:hypothetical protein [Thermoplasmata archaeon]